MMLAPDWLKILAGCGWMGHRFFVVERRPLAADAVDGWRVVAQSFSLAHAEQAGRDWAVDRFKIIELTEDGFLFERV